MRLFFELRPQLAFFHGLDRARGFLFMFFECLGKLLFELLQAFSLALGPLRLQLFLFHSEVLRRTRGLALGHFEFIAAAVQVSDQGRGLVRFGRELRARPVDDVGGQPQAPCDIDAA